MTSVETGAARRVSTRLGCGRGCEGGGDGEASDAGDAASAGSRGLLGGSELAGTSMFDKSTRYTSRP